MTWNEKINAELELLIKRLFAKEDIKNKLKLDKAMITNLVLNLKKIETILNDDVSFIRQAKLGDNFSFRTIEAMHNYIFQLNQLIEFSDIFIEYCNKTIDKE